MLAGMAALLSTPVLATEADPADAALDAAAALPPAQGLALLKDVAAASPARRLDLSAARAGLAIDAALADRPGNFALHLARTLGNGVSPDAAVRRLDRALAELEARAAALFDALGIRGPDIGDRFRQLFAGEAGRYPDDATGRARAVSDMAATLRDLRAATPALLGPVPPYCLDVSVRSLSAAEVAAGRQGYREAPAPGRPGAYVVDLRDVSRRPAWSLPSVVAHELLPGHMVQLGIEQATPLHPLRLRYAGAFVEGWATYAEALAAPRFDGPRAMLGHLHWLIFRAGRARIDLGVHHQSWPLDQARAKLAAWQGVPVYFTDFETDLARIAKEPGTRAAEALAWLALADRAARDPAARRRWHGAVLADGRKRLEQLP